MKNYWTLSRENIFVAAHRGWSAKYPENTMEAFRAAVEIGVDQVETDVHMSKDGEFVLIHDATVDRTTNGSGAVRDMTFAELQELDAGIKKGEEFKGAKIPKLTDLMDLIKDHPTMTLDIELKVYPTEGNEEYAYDVCDKVLAIIDEYNYTDRVVINSWSAKLNEYVFQKYGKKYRQHVYYPESCMGECAIDPYSFAYCACMFKDGSIMSTEEEFAAMKAKGVSPWAGAGVKNAEGVDMAIKNGAELITCNNPDVILECLRERGVHK